MIATKGRVYRDKYIRIGYREEDQLKQVIQKDVFVILFEEGEPISLKKVADIIKKENGRREIENTVLRMKNDMMGGELSEDAEIPFLSVVEK